MSSNNGYALLIGVDDYTSYDGALDLSGSRQDVIKLYWFCTAVLGFPQANIRVLASPALTPADFGPAAPSPEALGEATHERIQAGVTWLADRMQQASTAAGLLTFSGHGSWSRDRGPLLCPADVGRDLGKAVAVRDLSRSEALQKVRERLTVLLDCCHVSPTAPPTELRVHTALPHDGTPEEVAADHADFDISERVLLAARLGQRAHQALLGRVFHGALTFAVIAVAEQWKAAQGPGSAGLDISHKQLFKRTRQLLEALRMQQSPKLYVPLARRQKIRKMPFLGTQAGLTQRKADGLRENAQVDGGWCYTITITTPDTSSPCPLAVIVASGNNDNTTIQLGEATEHYTANPSTECWYVNDSSLALLGQKGSTINVASKAIDTSSSPAVKVDAAYSGNGRYSDPYFTCGVAGKWSSTMPPAGSDVTSFYYQSNAGSGDASGTPLCMRWDLTGQSPDYRLGQVVWYFMNSVLPQLQPGGTFSVSGVPTAAFQAAAS